MSHSLKPPPYWDDLSFALLKEECQKRAIDIKGRRAKHELMHLLVQHDRKQRAEAPRPVFDYDNDPYGLLQAAQRAKDSQDKARDLSALRAEAAFYKEKLNKANMLIDTAVEEKRSEEDKAEKVIINRLETYKRDAQ